MPKISVLPDHIASQIAAGEVVERPASVVKELVENSIDAGAGQIEIAIGADCCDIRIADDGCGMSADDAVLAFQRHATSKLSSAEDLYKLSSLGFRGEALPSIASVAKVTCLTRAQGADTGTKVEVADGKVNARETGCAPGTVIEVTDLFYNVPARLKFLKKGSTEFAHIYETVQSLALAYPKIVFQLLNEGEIVLKTSGSGNLAEAIVETKVFSGKEKLIPIADVDGHAGLSVYGCLARPPYCRSDRKGIITIVNNRPVRCSLTYKALDYAFSDLIPKGKYPLAVIIVMLDPQQVDVNIHPAKREIKYSNASAVYLAIQKALMNATHGLPVVSSASDVLTNSAGGYNNESRMPALSNAVSFATGITPAVMEASSLLHKIGTDRQDTLVGERIAEQTGEHAYQRVQQLGFRDRFAYADSLAATTGAGVQALAGIDRSLAKLPLGWSLQGYIHNTYMLFETPEGFCIVEQHIAHERVLYEQILATQNEPGRVNDHVQPLVVSAPLNLTPAQQACLTENLDSMHKLGFEFDLQADTVACTQVPLELATKDYAGNIQNIIEQLLACESANFSLEATKSLACQAAIKNGMGLTEQEIINLIAEWYACPRNDSCPHGRPICLTFSKEKLFQMFHPK